MKTILTLTSLLLGFSAYATTINCGTNSSVTSCTSNDVPSSNIVNLNSSGAQPQSAVVINSPQDSSVELATSPNSVSLSTRLFLSNSGTALNLNLGLNSKWDTAQSMNGLSSASNASSVLVLADVIGNLSIDVSGYTGKQGKSSAELCAERILAGEYGETQKNAFIGRCSDGSTANPCSQAKIRKICDAQDIQTLNDHSGAVAGACPTGFTYMSNVDDNPNPALSVTKLNPKPLRKCVRRSYQTTARTCRWREFTCQYNFATQVNDFTAFAFKYPSGWTNPSAIISVTGQAFYHPHLCLAYDSGSCTLTGINYGTNTPLANFTIRMKEMNFDNATTPTCPTPVITEGYRGTNYSGIMAPWFGGTMAGPQLLTSLTNSVNDGQAPPEAGCFLCLPTYNNVRPPAATSLATFQTRSIDASEQCLGSPYETDQGVSSGPIIPADVGYVEKEDSCPASADPTRPGYTDEGIVTDHNLTSPFTGLKGGLIDPQISTTIPDCTRTACLNVNTTYSSSNAVKEVLTLGSGERGSYGGKATLFVYDIIGTQNFNYSNGANGPNGVDNLTVNSVIKNCSAISANGSPSPQAAFHQTFWKPFSFVPSSTSYNNTFPVRTQSEAISVFKKVSPGVQDLIKKSTCSNCP